MMVRRIVKSLGKLILVIFLVAQGLITIGGAQGPVDLYQPGPDPVAPSLPAQDLAPGEENGQVADKKDGNGDLDMLDLDPKQLSQVVAKAPMMDIEVSSVSRTQSSVGKSPAAIFVITPEMIRRSAATNIPDLLRLVPGLEVARIDAHSWAISARGFNGRFANKLLVLVDGRTIYTPIFAGVYWDVQDVLLEDIERIEVIRGPGGTLWGANAVNGVINIITKRAKDTKGTYIAVGGGTEEHALNAFRYGGQFSDDMQYRIYGRQGEYDSGWAPGGANDDWRQGCAGFRVDWEPGRAKKDLFTVQGDYYVAREGLQATTFWYNAPYINNTLEDEKPTGGNLVARWTHKVNDDSDWVLQTYFDQFRRQTSAWTQNVDTFDVDFQHRFPMELRRRHDIIWGANFRQIHDREITDNFNAGFDPATRTTDLFGMFVQDQITLAEDRLFFIAGSKFEHNDYTGFEYQPSGRLLYTPDDTHTFWGAVSRAVRTPDRYDENGFLTAWPQWYPFWDPPQYYPRFEGNPDLKSEDMMAYEIGYRAQPSERFGYDIALFYNKYDNIILFDLVGNDVDHGQLILLWQEFNGGRMDTWGVEINTDYQVSERWRLSAAYTFLNMDLEYYPGPFIQVSSYTMPGFNPQNQARLISHWDLSRAWQFDMIVRYVDSLKGPIGNAGPPYVPSYITMDLRLGWAPSKYVEFEVIGRNLLDNHHAEMLDYGAPVYADTEVERSVFGRMTLRY
ncbi:MAG: TonB-dependent receptor [Pirellulales bacterium]|nr:TonB-dependent receptor [Pirellulales bacterium]